MAKDLYATLGVDRNASAEDIKKAYRKMSKEFHPDKHKGDKAAETKFKEINEAYETLSNPERKRMYDQFGSTSGSPGGGGFEGFQGFDFNGADLGDLFGNFFGGRGGGRQREEPIDQEVSITIDFMDAVRGVQLPIRLKRMAACDTCKGNGAQPGTKIVQCSVCSGTGQTDRVVNSFFGQIRQRSVCSNCRGSGKVLEKPCATCKGEGRVQEAANVTIDIPAGIDDGQTLRISGQGDAKRGGGATGDLYVRIRVTPDERFRRDHQDIYSDVAVPVIDALLGGTMEIDTVQGTTTIQIPEGMQPGLVLRIRGKGMPILGRNSHGDHYVTLAVDVPKKLSRKERKILEEWKEMRE